MLKVIPKTYVVAMIFIGSLFLAGCGLSLPPDSYLVCANAKSTGDWPYDMKWCQEDDNGWPINPGYYGGPFQNPAETKIKEKKSENYAHEVSFTEGLWSGPFMNYDKTVVFTGDIYWNVHTSDDDYNMDLLTPWFAGVSQQVEKKFGSIPLLHLEFDSDETIDYYDDNGWWNAFHAAVDEGNEPAQSLVDGKKAIVIGRWVMDCANGLVVDLVSSDHGCRSEVHPVLGLAIQTEPMPISWPGEEKWNFFLRARGNQGYSGNDNMEGIYSDTVFRFPGRPGTKSARLDDVWVFEEHAEQEDFNLVFDGDDLLLTIHLPYTSDWMIGTVIINYED